MFDWSECDLDMATMTRTLELVTGTTQDCDNTRVESKECGKVTLGVFLCLDLQNIKYLSMDCHRSFPLDKFGHLVIWAFWSFIPNEKLHLMMPLLFHCFHRCNTVLIINCFLSPSFNSLTVFTVTFR